MDFEETCRGGGDNRRLMTPIGMELETKPFYVTPDLLFTSRHCRPILINVFLLRFNSLLTRCLLPNRRGLQSRSVHQAFRNPKTCPLRLEVCSMALSVEICLTLAALHSPKMSGSKWSILPSSSLSLFMSSLAHLQSLKVVVGFIL